MKKLSAFCGIMLSAVCAHAQQAAPTAAAPKSPPPLPTGPLLKPVPDNTRWTVVTTTKPPPDAKPEEKAAAPTTTLIGEGSGKSAHVILVKPKTGREEKWTDGKVLESLEPGVKQPIFTTTSIDKIPLPTWVAAENFSDIKTEGTKDYLIFRTRVVPTGTEVVQDLEKPDADSVEKLKVDAIATIDGDTRLPVAVKEGDNTTTYKFEPLAPDSQIIPAAVQADLAAREKRMQDMVRKPVHP